MQVSSLFPVTSSFVSVSNCVQRVSVWIFKHTLEPFVGSILKICLYREAYLTGRVSQWTILPIVRTIGNLWFRLQGLLPVFTAFDPERLRNTEQELLKWGQKELIAVGRDREILFAHFQASLTPSSTCVLYLNGFGVPYQTAKHKIYQHLDAGFDFAVFEWGNQVSMKDFVDDAEAAFQALLAKGYSPDKIKILGYCGTTYVAAYLKLKHHAEGVDAILVNPHTSLRDVIAKSNRIGLLGLGAISTDEYDLDNEKTLRQLPCGAGSTCLVIDSQNSITPPDTVQRLQAALDRSGCVTIPITEKFNTQFDNPKIWEQYAQFIRGRSASESH